MGCNVDKRTRLCNHCASKEAKRVNKMCPYCKRACVSMEYGNRICPTCGKMIKSEADRT